MYRVPNYDGYECERDGYYFGPQRSLTGSYVHRKRRERYLRECEARVQRTIQEARDQGYEVYPSTGGGYQVSAGAARIGTISSDGQYYEHKTVTLEWADSRLAP